MNKQYVQQNRIIFEKPETDLEYVVFSWLAELDNSKNFTINH